MNKVIIVGTLGKNPEVKFLESGKAMCNLSIATSESVKNGDNWEKKTEWHNVTIWGKRAESAAQYLSKGCKVSVEGKLQTRSWEKDGKKQYKLEVIASEVEFLTMSKNEEGQQGVVPSAPSQEDIPF